MKIDEIKKMSTVHVNNHESIYKAYQTLQKVKEMLVRGDSKETILEIIEFIETDNDIYP